MNRPQRTALITGAGQFVGLGIARALAEDGFHVLINDIDASKAAAAVEEIRAGGGSASSAVFDVTDFAAVTAAVENISADYGGVDVLINNAGNAGAHTMNMSRFKDMPQSEWDRYLSVNLYGVLNCTKAVISGMCERGWGRVITISSEAGRVGLDIGVSLYGVAKAGAAHLMRHLAREVGPDGVTCNIISLGLMNNVPEEFSAGLIKGIPVRRLGSPEDIGASASYLCSDGASWVTGQTLVVNGGVQTH